MEIRRATVSDAAGIARVHVLGWQTVYRGALPQAYLDSLDPAQHAQMWSGLLPTQEWPRAGTLVAVSDSEIVGFAGFCPSRDADADPVVVGEMATLYLLPSVWRSGLGSRLMDASLAVLAEAGYRESTLWVLDANDRARRFYEATGWHHDGTVERKESDTLTLTELRYRRPLVHTPPTYPQPASS